MPSIPSSANINPMVDLFPDHADKPVTFAFNELHEAITQQIMKAGEKLLGGALLDLRDYAAVIAIDAIEAMKLHEAARRPLLFELTGQLKTLGEINRIRANDESWSLFTVVVQLVLATAVRTTLATVLA